jgi:PPK2 family polyphosphate:nucleotide phosphotransferase
MFTAPDSDYLVPFDGTFRIDKAATKGNKTWKNKVHLKVAVQKLDDLQKALYAANRHALLLVFQGMDAAGKDSTIRAVMGGINPAGCQVFSFKKPSSAELDHDFLWRTTRSLPERGRIGIFNRSYYEEVLVVRVHPKLLEYAQLPDAPDLESIWDHRFDSIRDHEQHLARNGTIILKFFLNVSRKEQTKRLLSRLDTPEKQWKFNPGDMEERAFWNDYQHAFEDALNATSRDWAPWYAIPADNKPYMRASIAEIIVNALDSVGLKYPQPSDEDRAQFDACRNQLTGANGQ